MYDVVRVFVLVIARVYLVVPVSQVDAIQMQTVCVNQVQH